MEPDLDRLLDFEAHGGLFPQFEETWPDAFAAAMALRKSFDGLSHRPRIAIETSQELSFCAVFLAFCRGDFDLFLFNPRWGKTEREHAMEIAEPDLVIKDFEVGAFATQDCSRLSREGSKLQAGMRVMIPTGGTTGRIRFAIHRWSTLAASAYGFQQFLNCNRIASHCVLPLYHVSGFMQLIRSLLSVGCIAFGRIERFRSSHLELAQRETSSRFLSLVPTQLERLVADVEVLPLLREYTAIFVGGGAARPSLLDECRRLGLPLAPTYGMTETAAQVATMSPESFLRGKLGQGRALPHARIAIVSLDDEAEPIPAGEQGRIRISATSLFLGYYREPESTTQTIVTSDLGFVDGGGYLTVLGRADQIIISGGEKINPSEVEAALAQTQLTRDAVAFGVEDREWGQKLVVAYVPIETFVTEVAVRDSLRSQLADYKMPKHWIRRESIPRNEAGKPLMFQLLESASNR